MAHASTDGLGVVARAAPCPPRALVIPLAPLLCSINTVTKEEWQWRYQLPDLRCGGRGSPPQQRRYYSPPHPFLPDNGIEC